MKRTLPVQPWTTSAPGTFARRTLEVRVPKILEDTVHANASSAWFTDDLKERCHALHGELTKGKLRALVDDADDKASWDAQCAPYVGRSWLDLPWYFAESFFYRRLLEATCWTENFEDPFLPTKDAEERAMMPKVAAARAALSDDDDARLRALVLASLWGNRADLSYTAGRAFGDAGALEDLVVDERERAHRMLTDARSVGVLLDNAGTELAFDLLLADELDARGKDVVLYAKSHPFFVSDATVEDVERTADLLRLGDDRFDIVEDAYLTSSGFFFTSDMPEDLVAELSAFDVVIVKGDANYRRLVGDAPWPHDTSVDVATEFPAPFIALRTLKAEVAVGVAVDVEERARSRDPEWLVNGRRGMVQVSERRARR